MSFPSQNPYTDRRPDEPRMPRGMEWSMLSKDEKERLRGLAKEHAENIGLHILAAYTLLDDDPAAALEHAQWVARQASRIDFSRETLAFVAYRQGDYKLALREFRTAHRMNGFTDYLPFIADCERGLGDPKKAISMALSDEGKALQGEAKAEMFLVYAGALADIGVWDKAVDVVRKLADSTGLPGAYRMRALQAEQYFLEESGHGDEAADINPILDQLEERYADEDEDDQDENVVIDYDLEELPAAVMEKIGITWDDAAYAPQEQEPQDPERDEEPSESSKSEETEEAGESEETRRTEEIAGTSESERVEETEETQEPQESAQPEEAEEAEGAKPADTVQAAQSSTQQPDASPKRPVADTAQQPEPSDGSDAPDSNAASSDQSDDDE